MDPAAALPTGPSQPTRVRYGVLLFACSLSMITYIDRVSISAVSNNIQSEFALTKTQMGWIFGAFAFAYAVFEIPSGWLGDMFGPRKTLIRIVLWWSSFTALTGCLYPIVGWPTLAFAGLLTVWFLFGMGEAGAYPNIARAFHNWFPFGERGFIKGAVWMCGRFAGGITPLIVFALLYETSADGGTKIVQDTPVAAASTVGLLASPLGQGSLLAISENVATTPIVHWRHMFWIFGSIGAVWCVGFWYWFRDRPEQKASVNAAEIALIHEGETLSNPRPVLPIRAGTEEGNGGEFRDLAQKTRPANLDLDRVGIQRDISKPGANPGPLRVPWGKLVTNVNLWILCLIYFCGAFGWYFNITHLPNYLREFHHITPGVRWSWQFWQASLMTGMPLLLGSVACLIGGVLSDLFIRLTGNRKWGRRLFGVVGHGLGSLCFFSCLFVDSAWGIVWAVSLAAFCNDLTMGASWASCLDIGRKFSGIVAGCMNSIGNLGGAVAAVLTGRVIDMFTRSAPQNPEAIREATHSGYTWMFMVFGGVYFIAMILWLFFDSTKRVDE